MTDTAADTQRDLTADEIRSFMERLIENGATPQQEPMARRMFDGIINELTDPDEISRWQVLREYACCPQFRAEYRDYTWKKTRGK